MSVERKRLLVFRVCSVIDKILHKNIVLFIARRALIVTAEGSTRPKIACRTDATALTLFPLAFLRAKRMTAARVTTVSSSSSKLKQLQVKLACTLHSSLVSLARLWVTQFLFC